MKVLSVVMLALLSAGMALTPALHAQSPEPAQSVRAGQTWVYMVKFIEPGLLYNDGQHGAFPATAPSLSGARKLDVRTPAAVSYRDYLASRQDNYLAEFSSLLKRPVTAQQRYDVVMNGVAVRLTADEAKQLRTVPGVVSVDAEEIYEMDTDAGPAFIGAPSIWNGSGVYSALGTRGQGVVVGVFDSGANSDHPSFANDPSCGFSVATPKLIAAKDCNTTNCATGNGEDVSIFVDAANPGSSGHGVHTSSTAAGGFVAAGTLAGGVPARFDITGVAPCARLITYKVCGDTLPTGFASCRGTQIAAAIQQSIVDQVDVVNFSISGGSSPWTDNDRGFLDMVNADIVVAASAGNTSATVTNPVGAVNHKGPWVMTVANSTHDRIITNPISVAGSLQNVPSQASNGTPFASTLTVNVASAALLGNEYGCTAAGGFAANSMSGKIALIQRGPPAPATACGFSEKINNAAAAGAIGVVIYDRTTGAPLLMDVTTTPTTIPAVFIRQAAGYAIRDFLATSPNALMTLVAPSQRLIDSSVSDVLNASSLRGPNTTFDVTKPDITGPGTNIYAATSDNFGQYGFLTGTSMSSPHLAGAAALIRSAQPTWTPQEVKSAIQLTASPTGRKEDETTPWNSDDVGNGRIDLTKAARSGLVMNETFANFLAANPTSGNPNLARQLNLPSMRHVTVVGSYAFTRTFRNASGKALTWEAVTTGAPAGTTVTVTPSTFTFGADPLQTQTVTITVTLNQALAAPTFGSVTFRPTTVYAHGFEDGPQFPNPARLTLTVQGNP